MAGAPRHRVEEHDAGDDEGDAGDGGEVERLAERHGPDDRDEHDSDPGPDALGDPERDLAQRQGQARECGRIERGRGQRGEQPPVNPLLSARLHGMPDTLQG